MGPEVSYLIILITSIAALDRCIELTARFANRAPDGVTKEVITLNDQFPGPTLYARMGETINVRVWNRLRDGNGTRFPTSVHFHGIEQIYSPWMDGPEQVTQCPIPYNSYMDYTITLYQSGTYWYHSHHAWQYVDGFWGLMVVNNTPSEVHRYDDDILISITDWHHLSAGYLSKLALASRNATEPGSGEIPQPTSALINGRGNANCSQVVSQNSALRCDNQTASQVTVFNVVPGLTYRIRVVNPSARAAFDFSIDGHQLRTIEVDGVDTVEVAPVDVVTIWPAQRYSFLVTMNSKVFGGNAWIRANILNRDVIENIQPLAALHYLGSTPPGRRNLLRNGSPGGGVQGRPPTSSNLLGNASFGPPPAVDGLSGTTNVVPPIPCASRGYTRKPENLNKSQETSNVRYFLFWTFLKPVLVVLDQIHCTVQALLGIGNIQTGQNTCGPRNYTKLIQNLDKSQETVNARHFAVWSAPSPDPILLDQRDCISMSRPNMVDTAPQYFDMEVVLNVEFNLSQEGFVRGTMNGVSYDTHDNQVPVIFRVMKNQQVPNSFVPVETPLQQVVQIVINNLNIGRHPWHLHGHTFWVLGTGEEGDCAYNASRDASKLDTIGMRRDTTHTLPQSWSVVRYVTDNPGVWLFHCHINWHLEQGLGAVFVEGKEVLQAFSIPGESRRVCRRHGVRI